MTIRVTSLLFIPSFIAACGGDGMDEATRGNVVLTNANNYTSVSTLSPPTVETASGADLSVCWGGIRGGHALLPTNVTDTNTSTTSPS